MSSPTPVQRNRSKGCPPQFSQHLWKPGCRHASSLRSGLFSVADSPQALLGRRQDDGSGAGRREVPGRQSLPASIKSSCMYLWCLQEKCLMGADGCRGLCVHSAGGGAPRCTPVSSLWKIKRLRGGRYFRALKKVAASHCALSLCLI